MAIVSFDTTSILNYYNAKLASSAASASLLASAGSSSSSPSSASSSSSSAKPLDTSGTVPPWDASQPQPTTQQADAAALSNTPFISLTTADLSNVKNDGTAAQDNARLFAVYQAATRLSTLATMASDKTAPSGTLAGLNARFQQGLSEIQSFLSTQSFDNITVIPGVKTSSATSSVVIPPPTTSYTGGIAVKGDVFQAVPGLSPGQTITLAVTKNGTTTNMSVDLSQIQGTLSLDNIASAINAQLAANGMVTRFHRVEIGDAAPGAVKSFGLEIEGTTTEKLTMSASNAQAAVYMAGTTGTGDNQNGRLVKLTGLDDPTLTSVFSRTIAPDPPPQADDSTPTTTTNADGTTSTLPTPTVSGGTANARASVVDTQGNLYVVGDTTGTFGNQTDQGTSDVFLRKYDSAGNLLWTRLLGSSDSGTGYALALDPKSGGVVVAGAVTGDLSPTAVGGGSDSFVARYSTDGEQTMLRQVSPVANDSARALTVGSDGSIYLGGQVSGTIASGQTNAGGQDAYVTKLDATGKLVYNRQFGTSGSDVASQVALTDDGGLVVASQQNGHAIVTKYASADGTSAALWQIDLGDLKGGALGGIAVKDGAVYVSGATGNAQLTAGGQATVANAFSGGSDAFVAKIDDAGTSATANYVSYVGTASPERGGGVTVTDDGVYLTGSTSGTFAGESAPATGASNAFVAKLGTDGSLDWAHQFGGFGGQSTGASIAVDSSGASALDSLGLPKTVTGQESLDLESQSTVRAGDYFTLNVTDPNGNTRSKRITIDPGETLQSLSDKLNAVLVLNGKASVSFGEDGRSLAISANKNAQITLVPGQGSFDALAGLGISNRVLVNDDPLANQQPNAPSTNDSLSNILQGFNADGTPVSSSSGASSSQKKVVGLDITPGLSLSSTTAAASAATQMLGLLATIRTAYRTINPDPALQSLLDSSAAAASKGKQGGAVPAEVSKQLAGYQTALARLGGGTTTSS